MSAGTGYLVAPPGGQGGPGVLVLHAWWGLTPFFRHLCDRLADAGYVALAPDLHAGEIAETEDEGRRLLAQVDVDRTAHLVRSSAATLHGLPITPQGPIGVVGFSMGASWALWLAARAPEQVGATVAFYGMQHMDMGGATAAFQGHFAEDDPLVPADDVAELYGHLQLIGRKADFHTYPGTGHWFFEEDREAHFRPHAARLAWERTLGFLGDHLRAA